MPPGYYATIGRLGINLLLLVIDAPAAHYRSFSTLCKFVQKAAIDSVNWEISWFYSDEERDDSAGSTHARPVLAGDRHRGRRRIAAGRKELVCDRHLHPDPAVLFHRRRLEPDGRIRQTAFAGACRLFRARGLHLDHP